MNAKTLNETIANIPTTLTVAIQYIGESKEIVYEDPFKRVPSTWIKRNQYLTFFSTTEVDIFAQMGFGPKAETEKHGYYEDMFICDAPHLTSLMGCEGYKHYVFSDPLVKMIEDSRAIIKYGQEKQDENGDKLFDLFDESVSDHSIVGGNYMTLKRMLRCAHTHGDTNVIYFLKDQMGRVSK